MNLLSEADLLIPQHGPVIMVINEFGYLQRQLEYLTQGDTFTNGYDGCSLWAQLDPPEREKIKQFDGVMFISTGIGSAVVTYEEMYHYYELAVQRYAEKYGDNDEKLATLLSEFKRKYVTGSSCLTPFASS